MKPTGINWCWRPAHILRSAGAGPRSGGCFVYRTLDDLGRIAACASGAKRGVVIGGGCWGWRPPTRSKQLGLETHVVEFAPNLMAVQLDNPGAAMLREKINDLGVGVHTSKRPEIAAMRRPGLNFADGARWRPTWWSSPPGFARRTRWRAAAD
jgi:NAD(P)H-nitrite reductase large subunit